MLVENIIEEIRRDIASFADPGTKVEISDRAISWFRSRSQVTAQLLRRPDGFPDILYGDRQYSYRSFLASEALADLKDLAATIHATTMPPSNFVPVLAGVQQGEDAPSLERGDASDLVLKYATDPTCLPLQATRVVFIHGNAGTGKTSTLQNVTRLQAERYLQGQADTLFLYLDAQGKGLSQLEDVMARALQDLRAKFTYHSVAALTRRRCVVPIVDGFDELIGPSSAREAFANLSQFLAQLDCEGGLIASSRSAFIDYRALYERAAEIAASLSLSYEILPIEVFPWDDSAVSVFCRQRSPDSGSLQQRIFALLGTGEGELLRKPFYLSKICDILEEGRQVDEHADITRQVVDVMLERETSKLRDQRGKELLTKDQHRLFCETIADEMWSLGKPELDCETIRLLAEIVSDQFGLSARDAKTFIDRSVAHGLLSVVSGQTQERRTFEHELFRFEFQAGSLAKLLDARGDPMRDYVRRAELPTEVVSRIPADLSP